MITKPSPDMAGGLAEFDRLCEARRLSYRQGTCRHLCGGGGKPCVRWNSKSGKRGRSDGAEGGDKWSGRGGRVSMCASVSVCWVVPTSAHSIPYDPLSFSLSQ
ncbi:hypothetical protein E2C01_085922 [Portunus trituberculatus]|uniref:Uncharacterized protein n=1 Tax=Portunus trituberculatus TaxID=210409 RepID=A0A5B7JD86_PORTR|nr:hypothetical protein [Portunus trituberculatus]